MAQITCQNITLGYEGHAVARDISFTVNSGDYLCIVGENGSGKSTLMKTILGLLPPLAGKILTGDHLKQTEIGYLPQQTEVQRDFPASVAEIVLSGCQGRMGLRPFYGAKEKELAEKNMDVIDAGIAVQNMHAPDEVVSKVDVYEAYRAYFAFLKDMQ